MNKEKWAIVGCGFISNRHYQGIKHVGDELKLTCDIDTEKNVDFVSFDEMLESEQFSEIDNVAICTPNHLHIPYALRCIEKGKKVLIEKPIGLSTEEIDRLPNNGSVFGVLQLRKHPELERYKRMANEVSRIGININVHRDQKYFDGWKGDKKRSGGLLKNLGVHYFDFIIQLFGNDWKVPSMETIAVNERNAHGKITFGWGNKSADFRISIDNEKPCVRDVLIGSNIINLSNQENLSYEDLHKYVYEDFKNGVGVLPQDARRAISLIEEIERNG